MAALQRNNGNQTSTGAELGISRTTLWRRLRRHGGPSGGEAMDLTA